MAISLQLYKGSDIIHSRPLGLVERDQVGDVCSSVECTFTGSE